MAFQNVLFPTPKLIHGIVKETGQTTKIISNGNTEYRIQKSQPRKRWTIPGKTMSAADRNTIGTFMKNVNFALDSFRFVDPFTGVESHVRFDSSSIVTTAEALDSSGNIIYVSIGDIVLVEVIGE